MDLGLTAGAGNTSVALKTAEGVLPILFAIILGFALVKTHVFNDNFMRGFHVYTAKVGLPCMLFLGLQRSKVTEVDIRTSLIYVLFALLMLILSLATGLIYNAILFCKRGRTIRAVASGGEGDGFGFENAEILADHSIDEDINRNINQANTGMDKKLPCKVRCANEFKAFGRSQKLNHFNKQSSLKLFENWMISMYASTLFIGQPLLRYSVDSKEGDRTPFVLCILFYIIIHMGIIIFVEVYEDQHEISTKYNDPNFQGNRTQTPTAPTLVGNNTTDGNRTTIGSDSLGVLAPTNTNNAKSHVGVEGEVLTTSSEDENQVDVSASPIASLTDENIKSDTENVSAGEPVFGVDDGAQMMEHNADGFGVGRNIGPEDMVSDLVLQDSIDDMQAGFDKYVREPVLVGRQQRDDVAHPEQVKRRCKKIRRPLCCYQMPVRILLRILFTPEVISIVLGIIVSWLPFVLPDMVLNGVKWLSDSASPVAVVELGVFLGLHFSAMSVVKSLYHVVMKVFIAPLIAIICCYFVGIKGTTAKSSVVLLSIITSSTPSYLVQDIQHHEARILGPVLLGAILMYPQQLVVQVVCDKLFFK